MYQIDLYNRKQELVGSFYINPAAVATLYCNIKNKEVTGRLFNGQAFSIPYEKLEEFKTLVDNASGGGGGGGGGHSVDQLPYLPVGDQAKPGETPTGSLAQVNQNLKFIWENTKEGKAKLTPEELAGKNS